MLLGGGAARLRWHDGGELVWCLISEVASTTGMLSSLSLQAIRLSRYGHETD
jgi:hypothetical protein